MVLQRDIVLEHLAVVYHAIEALAVGTYLCPVPHCIGEVSTKWALRRHFLDRHPQDLVVIPSEGSVPFLKCERCAMQTEIGALYGEHWVWCTPMWDKNYLIVTFYLIF